MRPPFHSHGIPERALEFKIYSGLLPKRPVDQQCHGGPVSDELWTVIEQCLKPQITDRATILGTLAALQDLIVEKVQSSTERLDVIMANDGPLTSPTTPTFASRFDFQ